MSVRAKFKVISITITEHWDKTKGNISTIKLSPVISGSDKNKEFYAATPSGDITLGTINDSAASQFELGKEYYVDFTLSE